MILSIKVRGAALNHLVRGVPNLASFIPWLKKSGEGGGEGEGERKREREGGMKGEGGGVRLREEQRVLKSPHLLHRMPSIVPLLMKLANHLLTLAAKSKKLGHGPVSNKIGATAPCGRQTVAR